MTPFLDTHAVNSAGASKLWSVYLFRFRTSIPDFVVLNSKNFKMVCLFTDYSSFKKRKSVGKLYDFR